MYHCNVHFYLAGHQRKVFEIIKGMSPLAHFTHVFSESIRPDPELAARADVILADLQDVDVLEAVPKLLSAKGSEAELILLAANVWMNPMIFDSTVEESCRKFMIFGQMLRGFGLDIVDDEMLARLRELTSIYQRNR